MTSLKSNERKKKADQTHQITSDEALIDVNVAVAAKLYGALVLVLCGVLVCLVVPPFKTKTVRKPGSASTGI